jgi:hypothetical protein
MTKKYNGRRVKPSHFVSALICSATLFFIGKTTAELTFTQLKTKEIAQEGKVNESREKRLESGQDRDPFLLPSGIYPLSKGENKGGTPTVTKEKESKVGRVKAILISSHIRLALVDRRIVAVGDSINGEKVVEIRPNQLVLGEGGKKKALFLYQSAIPLRVEEN